MSPLSNSAYVNWNLYLKIFLLQVKQRNECVFILIYPFSPFSQVLRMLEGEMIFDANGSPTSAYFAGRLNNYPAYHLMMGPTVREEVKYPNFVSPQSDYHSSHCSPNSTLSNLPYGPMMSSPTMNLSPTSREFNKKLTMVPAYVNHDGVKLSYEALRAAYMDKVSSNNNNVSASAYESYQLGKDF